MRRRKFLKNSLLGAGALVLDPRKALSQFINSINPEPLVFGPRKRIRIPNPYITQDGKPRLVCVEGTNLRLMLEKGFKVLGGLERLVQANQGVLIKPNLVYSEPYPSTSSPESITELIWMLRGITTNIKVGDQGGQDPEIIYEYLGLGNAVHGAGAQLIKCSDTRVYPTRSPLWSLDIPSFNVYSAVYIAPIIINMCTLKRHAGAGMTCSLKNNIGNIDGLYNSGTRGYVHYNQEISFLEGIAETAALINPELSIVDARAIMTGNGPLVQSYENARVKQGVNKLIISADSVATDAYCAGIMEEHDPDFSIQSMMPTLERAEQLGMGTLSLEQVEIIEINETSDVISDISESKKKIKQRR